MDDLMTPTCAEGTETRWKYFVFRAHLEWEKKCDAGLAVSLACNLMVLVLLALILTGLFLVVKAGVMLPCPGPWLFWDELTRQICTEAQPLTLPRPAE